MGLRWDFVSPNKDQTGKYHSMRPQDVYGPTGVGLLFHPGAQSLTGTFDPVYVTREASHGSWNVTPQPSAGVAWTPRSDGSFIERMLGGDKSVLRGSYSFRRFTMPQQFIWDYGSCVWHSVLPEFQCTARYHRRTREVRAGQHGARPGRLAAAIMRQLICSAVLHLQPGELRPGRPLDGINLPQATLSQACPKTFASPTLRPGPWAFSGNWARGERSRFATTAIARVNSGSRTISMRSTSSKTASLMNSRTPRRTWPSTGRPA